MTPTKKLIERAKYITKGLITGPYRVERVDFDDEITYEVSGKVRGFHVVFRESDFEKGSPKNQATFYAESYTLIPQLIEHLERYERALEKCKEEFEMMFCEDVCNEINAELEAILNPQEKGE